MGPDRGEVLGYAAVASLGTLAGVGFLQGTQLLAYWYAAPDEVAHLAAAVALVTPLLFLPRALSLALFPAMADAHGAGDRDRVRRHADLYTRVLAVAPVPVIAAAAFLAPQMLTLFGGREFADGAPVLRIMLVSTYLTVVQVPAVNALASDAGIRSWIPAAAAVGGCLLGLGAVALSAPALGAAGIALGHLLGTAVTAAVPIGVVWQRLGLRWAPLLARTLGSVVAATVAAALLGTAVDTAAGAVTGAVIAILAAAAVLGRDLRDIAARTWGQRSAAAQRIPATRR